MNKHILLVCYVFPPYPGIGGRRWAKFAKYLAKKGYTVHVINSENPFPEVSNWTQDVQSGNIHVHSLSLRYPRVLITQPKNIFEKIIYHAWVNILPLFSRGTIYDRALFWKKMVLKHAFNLIEKHQIKSVIVSGAPFHLLHHCLEIKKKFPATVLLSDFRDPWTDGKTYGMGALSKKRLEYEKNMEKETVLYSDYISYPSQDYVDNNFKKKYSSILKNSEEKFMIIPHGFDEDDFKNIPSDSLLHPHKKVKFLYAGSMYTGIYHILDAFVNSLLKIKAEMPDLYNRLQIDFYTDTVQYEKLFKNNSLDVVRFHNPVNSGEYFSKITETDFIILFLSFPWNLNLTTKVVESLPLRKRLLAFSDKSFVTDYIQTNRIGSVIYPDQNVNERFLNVLNNYIEGKDDFNTNFDVNQFSYNVLADNLLKKLIK
mgnify:CR=1 FL=1